MKQLNGVTILSRAEKEFHDRAERLEIQKTWYNRLDKLDTSRAAFCVKHGLNQSIVCRLAKLDMAAEWETIKKIENAMKKEGI